MNDGDEIGVVFAYEYGEYNRVRGERFKANLPAGAAVQAAGHLQGALIEIAAVTFIPD